MSTRRTLLSGLAASATVATAPSALAQAGYPTRPITILCALGGSVEPIVRTAQPWMAEYLGQPVVVELRPGGGTSLAAGLVQKAPPDGYTLLFNAGASHVIVPLVQSHAKWDPVKDFTPIATFSRSGWVFVVHPDVPARSLAEFVAYMKANAGKVSYGSSGVGTGNHLQMARFMQAVGAQTVHVPYKTAAAGQVDLMAGRIHAYFTSASAMQPHIDAGKLRALAYTSTPPGARPDALKFATIGLPEFDEVDSINVLLGPPGLPASVVSRLSGAVEKALAVPALASAYGKLNQAPHFLGSKATTDRLTFEYEKLRKVIQDAKIRFET